MKNGVVKNHSIITAHTPKANISCLTIDIIAHETSFVKYKSGLLLKSFFNRKDAKRMNATLHSYQNDAVDFAVTHPKCGLFLDLGLGKTLISLAVLERLYNYETGHILIIAPKAIAKATWADEIEKWGVNIPHKSLIVNDKGKKLSKEKRLKAYAEVLTNPIRTIYFINRELLKDLIDNCPINDKKQLIWAFQTIVIDELQGFKSCKSERFKSIKTILPAVNRFIGLTGTPITNSIDDIWSQIFMMDEGLRLGKNITAFRSMYMHPGYTNQQGIVCNWLPNDGAEDIIYQNISDIVISMKNTNLKLPPIAFIDDYVHMSPDELKLYKRFVETAVLEFQDGTMATAANAAVLSAKLQQIASGSIYTIDEDGNPTGTFDTIHEQKLERLLYIRENSDDNLLVAYYFKSDAAMIMAYFAERGIPCEIFNSNKSDEYLRRWNAGEIPMLLIQPASAGFGLNFQYGGHTLVWYTLSFNLEHYLQTIGRVYRQGQTQTVYVHRLMTHKTIDSHVLHALIGKNDDMQRLLDAVELTSQNDSLVLFNQALTLASSNNTNNNDKLIAVQETLNDLD